MDSPSPSAADHPPQSYSGLLFIGPCEKSRIVAVIEICGKTSHHHHHRTSSGHTGILPHS